LIFSGEEKTGSKLPIVALYNLLAPFIYFLNYLVNSFPYVYYLPVLCNGFLTFTGWFYPNSWNFRLLYVLLEGLKSKRAVSNVTTLI